MPKRMHWRKQKLLNAAKFRRIYDGQFTPSATNAIEFLTEGSSNVEGLPREDYDYIVHETLIDLNDDGSSHYIIAEHD